MSTTNDCPNTPHILARRRLIRPPFAFSAPIFNNSVIPKSFQTLAGWLDGEIAVLDDAGRPRFNALLFHRSVPVYVAFDVLYAHGEDLRSRPLKARKTILKRLLRGRHDMVVLDGIPGRGNQLFQAVCELDLEGIVAKRLSDTYVRETPWLKITNPSYSQKQSRKDLFRRR